MTNLPRSFASPSLHTFRSGRTPPLLVRCLLLGVAFLAGGCGWGSLIGSIHRDAGGTGGVWGGDGGIPDGPFADGPAFDAAAIPITPVPDAHAPITSSAKLDLLFVIDDSQSMAPLQQKLRQRMADFMGVLGAIEGGLPSLHMGVVSSSLGAGVFGNVSGCAPGTSGNLNGMLQHSSACTMLPPSERFLKLDHGTNNFTGSVVDAFNCLSDLGSGGCGFEHPFEATRLALQRALHPNDTENAGFLRSDAFLGIIMLTNEDDCSVAADSMLFDPNQQHLTDPLGGLQSYRCNEFGHRCSGITPPHQVSGAVTLENCESAEDGKLVTVAETAEFLKSLKTDPSRVFVAAIAGPVGPYTILPHDFALGDGSRETQPQMAHSCVQATVPGAATEYADPPVRVAQLIRAFGPNGIMQTICADDFMPAMRNIGNSMVGMMRPAP